MIESEAQIFVIRFRPVIVTFDEGISILMKFSEGISILILKFDD